MGAGIIDFGGFMNCSNLLPVAGCWLFLAVSCPALAQPVHVPLVSEQHVVVDGLLEEPAWQEAAVLDLDYEISPGHNIPARYETRVYLAATRTHLLIAAKAADPRPHLIRAQLRNRDDIFDDDRLFIAIDPYDQQGSSMLFAVNALGIQMDGMHSSEGFDYSVDRIWDSAGTITEEGYQIEISIPFSSMRYPKSDGPSIWRIHIERQVQRGDAPQFSARPYDWSNECFECQFVSMELPPGIEHSRHWEWTPYLAWTSSDRRGYPYDGPWSSERDVEVGIDANWSPDSTSRLTLTLNPDFSQVEVDTIQFDINRRYAIEYPERRPFFTEDLDYFDSYVMPLNTRRIVDPSAGIKYTGTWGRHALGLFAADDSETTLVIPALQTSTLTVWPEPGSNAVVRYRYSMGEGTDVGGMATYRSAADYENATGSLIFRYKPVANHQFKGEMILSRERYPESVAGSLDQKASLSGYAYYVGHDYGRNGAYAASTSLWSRSHDFRSDLSQTSDVGNRWFKHVSSYTWREGLPEALAIAKITGTAYVQEEVGGGLLQRGGTISGVVHDRKERKFSALFDMRRQLFAGKEFDLAAFQLNAVVRPRPWLALAGQIQWGHDIDVGNLVRINARGVALQAVVQPDPQWDFRLTAKRSFFHEADERFYFLSFLYARLSHHFNRRHHLRFVGQYGRADLNADLLGTGPLVWNADMVAQLVYRYELNARTAVHAGFSLFGADDNLIDEVRSNQRYAFIKVSYHF